MQENSYLYELGYHILPGHEENQIAEEVLAIKSLISAAEGVVVAEGAPELLNLAYPISKEVAGSNKEFNKAHFGWLKFKLSPEEIEKFGKTLSGKPGILRFLIVKSKLDAVVSSKPETEQSSEEVDLEKDMDKSIDNLVIA